MWRMLSLLVLVSCKPAEEPSRRPELVLQPVSAPTLGASAGVRVTERVAPPVEPTTAPPLIGGVAVHAPDAAPAGGQDAGAPADSSGPLPLDGGPEAVDAAVEVAPVFATRPEDLPPDLVAALAADVPQAARDEARRLNKLGLDAHRDLELDAAQVHYRAALVGFPAYPFARYNLACALALQKRDAEALFHLVVLRHQADALRDTSARDRLEAARIDADFELLRDDPRFRALTGSTGVLVTWVAGGAAERGKKEASTLAKALREARWQARVAVTAWHTPVASNAIRVRGDDPIAEAAAKQIANLLQDASTDASAAAWPIEIGAPLPPEAPPIVVIAVLGGHAASDAPIAEEGRAFAAEPAPAVPLPDAGPGGVSTLADVLGKRLRAERATAEGVEHHQLELKSTGFFSWEVSLPGAVRMSRTGRWSGNDTRLTLSFKETIETPTPDGVGELTVKDGLVRELRVEVQAQGIVLDGLSFPLARP